MQTSVLNGYLCYGQPEAISVGASPFTYTNPFNVRCEVVVNGGTVSTLEFQRGAGAFTTIGLLNGTQLLNPGDAIRVTYITPPNMTIYPI